MSPPTADPYPLILKDRIEHVCADIFHCRRCGAFCQSTPVRFTLECKWLLDGPSVGNGEVEELLVPWCDGCGDRPPPTTGRIIRSFMGTGIEAIHL